MDQVLIVIWLPISVSQLPMNKEQDVLIQNTMYNPHQPKKDVLSYKAVIPFLKCVVRCEFSNVTSYRSNEPIVTKTVKLVRGPQGYGMYLREVEIDKLFVSLGAVFRYPHI